MDHGTPLSLSVPKPPGPLWRSAPWPAYGLLAIYLLQSFALRAQTTGLDFTANDCAGAPHHLFGELDSGSVVVLDLVMMNCPDCAPATEAIAVNIIPGTVEPERVRLYSIGYADDISCADITDWAADGGLTHPVFAGMTAQTDHYGGMGMPTIVVLGGTGHNIYYQHLGYAPGLDPIIRNAIDEALLAPIGISEDPGPVAEYRMVGGAVIITGDVDAAILHDVVGHVCLSRAIINGWLDVSDLPEGMYLLTPFRDGHRLPPLRFKR